MPTPCPSPLLFRHKETRECRVAPYRRWNCPFCKCLLTAHWRSVLNWVTQAGQPPQYLITLTLREELPLWRQASASQRQEQREAAVTFARFLTRAFTRLVAGIRKQFSPFEYLAFVESTTGRRTPGHRSHTGTSRPKDSVSPKAG